MTLYPDRPMTPLDLHTHRTPDLPGEAVQNLRLPHHTALTDGLYSVGLHPWHLSDDWETGQLPEVERLCTHPAVVALGECGLDKVCLKSLPPGLREAAFIRQIAAFEAHVRLSERVGKPLIIHCVKAFNELVVLHRRHAPHQPWVVHGFRGNAHVAGTLLDEGLYLSFGERYQAEALRLTPAGRLFAETDESRGSIGDIVAALARDRGTGRESLIRQLQTNYSSIFSL